MAALRASLYSAEDKFPLPFTAHLRMSRIAVHSPPTATAA